MLPSQNTNEYHPKRVWTEQSMGNVFHAAAAKLFQPCLTLCDPIDGSPPGSPIPGILQARTLEWVAISFSNARKWKVKGKSLSRVRSLNKPQEIVKDCEVWRVAVHGVTVGHDLATKQQQNALPLWLLYLYN